MTARYAAILLTIVTLLAGIVSGCNAGRTTEEMDGTIVARVVATLDSAGTASAITPTPPRSTATPVPEPTAVLGPTVTAPPEIEAAEYAVYSAMLQQNPVGFDTDSSILIREGTISGLDGFERTLEQVDPLPARLVDSYRSRNAASYTLSPNLDYDLIPEEEFKQVLQGKMTWVEFRDKYPDVSGVVFFSRVGFGANEDEALVEMGYRCGDLCGTGGLYLLVREDGIWTIQESLMEWMS